MQPDTKHLRAKVEKTRCVHAAQPLEPGQAHTTCAESRPQTKVHNPIAILQPSFKRYKTPDREHVQGDGTTTVNKETCDCKQHRLARLQAMLHASAARRRHAHRTAGRHLQTQPASLFATQQVSLRHATAGLILICSEAASHSRSQLQAWLWQWMSQY